MPKDLKDLVARLATFGKSASIENSVTDPSEKGPANTDVPKERLIAPLQGQTASTETTPAISASEPAGDAKVEHGESTGKVTPAQDYVEPATVAGAKSANLIAGASALRDKLANFGKLASPEMPAFIKEKMEEKTEEKEDEEKDEKKASDLSENAMLKVAQMLFETPGGIGLVNKALDERLGVEQAAHLVKAASAEYVEHMREYTAQRLALMEQEELQMKQAAYEQELSTAYAELTKGASEEQLEAVRQTSLLTSAAVDAMSVHPATQAFAGYGLDCALKMAMAMDQGMPPEEAAQMVANEGMGEDQGPPSMEEVEAALMTLIEQGVLTEEEAIQLLNELVGGAEGMEQDADQMGGMEQKEAAAVNEALGKIASTLFS